jgi:hypothetical protein
MRTTINGNLKTFEFDSVTEAFSEAIRVVKAIGSKGGEMYTNQFLGNSSRSGRNDLDSWEDLERAILTPWQKGIQIIERLRKEVPDQDVDFASVRRRKRNTSMDEGEVNLDNWIAGRCDYFDATEYIKINSDAQFINLAFSTSAPYYVTGDAFFAQGAALIAAIDKLEAQGHQVQLTIYCLSSGVHGNQRRSCILRVKEAGDPVNVETLATVLSPWFHRLVMLTLNLKDVEHGAHHDHGLGYPSFDFSVIEPFIQGSQNVERTFDLGGAIATFAQLSSMVQGGHKDDQ